MVECFGTGECDKPDQQTTSMRTSAEVVTNVVRVDHVAARHASKCHLSSKQGLGGFQDSALGSPKSLRTSTLGSREMTCAGYLGDSCGGFSKKLSRKATIRLLAKRCAGGSDSGPKRPSFGQSRPGSSSMSFPVSPFLPRWLPVFRKVADTRTKLVSIVFRAPVSPSMCRA